MDVNDLASTKGQESIIRPIKNKIRNYCKQKRVRLSEFFQTFDTHRTKKVTRTQFGRALELAGLILTSAEVDLLSARYQVPGQPDMVQYLKFSDQIDKVFLVKELEKHPLRGMPTSYESPEERQLGLKNQILSAIEIEDLKEILATVRHIVHTQGVILKMFFVDFDHSNNGCVTKEQFLRSLAQIVGTNISVNDMKLVAKAYDRGSNGVSYRNLHEDIMPADLNSLDDRSSTASVHPAPSLNDSVEGVRQYEEPSDLTKFETRLALHLQQRRIFLTDHFREFDPTGLGYCTRSEFTQVIGRNFTIHITQDQLEALMQKYRHGNKVRYPAFVKTLDLLAQRNGEIVPGSPINTIPLRRVVLTPSEQKMLDAYMQSARTYVNTKRILLKPPFQDFDPRREEHITREQFCRVLSTFDVLPPSPEAQSILLKYYASTDHRHPASSFVNYKRYLNDMEPVMDDGASVSFLLSAPSSSQSQTRPGSRSGRLGAGGNMIVGMGSSSSISTNGASIPIDQPVRRPSNGSLANTINFARGDRALEEILADIQNRALINRLRMLEYFQDIDKLRHGIVTVPQFRRALGQYNFQITNGEFQILLSRYGRQSRMGEQAVVSYAQFCAEVDAVFGIQGLEKEPTIDVDQAIHLTQLAVAQNTIARPLPGSSSTRSLGGSESVLSLNSAESQLLASTLKDIAEKVAHRGLELKPPFQDFDRLRRNYISAPMFERVLSQLGILPDAVACAVLKKKFREHSIDGKEDVNYAAFIAAVNVIMEGATVDEVQSSYEYRQNVREGATLRGTNNLDKHFTMSLTTSALEATVHPYSELQRCINEIRRQLAIKRVSLYDFLSDGDKYRSGEITTPKFRSALALAGLQLSQTQLQCLIDAYSSDKKRDLIDWKAFLRKVTTVDNSEGDGSGSSEDGQALLECIRKHVQTRGVFLRPYFQDYDKNHVWQVTKTQMYSVLDNLGFTISENERELLFRLFMVKEGNKATNRINYKEFVRKVDDIEVT